MDLRDIVNNEAADAQPGGQQSVHHNPNATPRPPPATPLGQQRSAQALYREYSASSQPNLSRQTTSTSSSGERQSAQSHQQLSQFASPTTSHTGYQSRQLPNSASLPRTNSDLRSLADFEGRQLRQSPSFPRSNSGPFTYQPQLSPGCHLPQSQAQQYGQPQSRPYLLDRQPSLDNYLSPVQAQLSALTYYRPPPDSPQSRPSLPGTPGAGYRDLGERNIHVRQDSTSYSGQAQFDDRRDGRPPTYHAESHSQRADQLQPTRIREYPPERTSYGSQPLEAYKELPRQDPYPQQQQTPSQPPSGFSCTPAAQPHTSPQAHRLSYESSRATPITPQPPSAAEFPPRGYFSGTPEHQRQYSADQSRFSGREAGLTTPADIVRTVRARVGSESVSPKTVYKKVEPQPQPAPQIQTPQGEPKQIEVKQEVQEREEMARRAPPRTTSSQPPVTARELEEKEEARMRDEDAREQSKRSYDDHGSVDGSADELPRSRPRLDDHYNRDGTPVVRGGQAGHAQETSNETIDDSSTRKYRESTERSIVSRSPEMQRKRQLSTDGEEPRKKRSKPRRYDSPPIWAQSWPEYVRKRRGNERKGIANKPLSSSVSRVNDHSATPQPTPAPQQKSQQRHVTPPSAPPQRPQGVAGPSNELDPEGLLGPWERSLTGRAPLSPLTKEIADFLFLNVVNRPDWGELKAHKIDVEIEAKLGLLIDKNTNQRLFLPIKGVAVLSEGMKGKTAFQGGLGEGAEGEGCFRELNQVLNGWVQESFAGKKQGRVPIDYQHRREIDTFHHLGVSAVGLLPPAMQATLNTPALRNRGVKVRVSRDQRTGKEIARIVKCRVADLDVVFPERAMDCRISVNFEMEWEGDLPIDAGRPPNPEDGGERRKDRLSYKQSGYTVDLTQVTSSVSAYLYYTHTPFPTTAARHLGNRAILAKP